MNKIRLFLPTFLCIFILGFLVSNTAIADNSVDSLYQLVQNTSNDSLKLQHYGNLLLHLENRNDPKIAQYTNSLMKWAQQKKFKDGINMANEYLGKIAMFNSDYEEAIRYLTKAKSRYEKIGDHSNVSYMLYMISYAYGILGNRKEEKSFAIEAAAEATLSNGAFDIGSTSSNLAYIYHREGNKKEALKAIDIAIEALKDYKNPQPYVVALTDKAIYLTSVKPEAAKKLLEEAQKIASKNKLIDNEAAILDVYLNVYQHTGEIKKALEIAFSALDDAKATNDKLRICRAYHQLGNLHLSLTNYDEAIKYFEIGEEIADNIQYTAGKALILSSIGRAHLANKKPKKAIDFFNKVLNFEGLTDRHALASVYLAQAYLEVADIDATLNVLYMADSLSSFAPEGITYIKDAVWGKYFLNQQQFEKAVNYGTKVYDYAQKNQNILLEKEASELLAEANKKLKNYELALVFFENFQLLEDSINRENHIKQLTTSELTNQFEIERENTAREQATKTQQIWMVAIGIGLLAILVFAFFWNARRKNKTISQQNDQLDQLNQTKDRIFAIIGHDLRKPAIGFRNVTKKVNYLLQKQDYKTLSALGNSIEKDALALNKLTDNLLSWALTQKNVMPYNPIALPLRKLTDEVISVFRPLGEEKGISINNDISEDLKVYADLNSLQAIIRNLVDNGIKYSNKDDVINITAVSTDKGVKIEIADTGIGMNQEKLRDIFLLKKEKSQKGTKGEKGTGLGLHLVQELVKLNKGLISAKSQLGLGTNFEVVLPAVA